MILILQKIGGILKKMILVAEMSSYVMSDDLKGAIITAIVTGIISIIGFIVTNLSMRKNFKNELIQQRDSLALEKMATMPFRVLDLMDRMTKAKKNGWDEKNELKNFQDIMNEIYSYGSVEAISLVALMQKENYAANGNPDKMNYFRVMSSYVLLATQIKFDVTGTYVNPELWFRMRLTDFAENRENIKKENNKLVDELNLNCKMKIK
nr:MAG TPA: hypothetical protein [Caudoviricetes sp.]